MEDHHLPETLRPFFDRATEAQLLLNLGFDPYYAMTFYKHLQERLARLEAVLASTKSGIADAKFVEETTQIQSKLEEANATIKEEQKKVKDLTTENEKQKYRILHLVRELRAANEKLEKLSK